MKHRNKVWICLLSIIILWVLCCHKKFIREGHGEWKQQDPPSGTPKGFFCCKSPHGVPGIPNDTKFIIKSNNLHKAGPNGELGDKVSDHCSQHGNFIHYQRTKDGKEKPKYRYKSHLNAYCMYSGSSNSYNYRFGGNPSCPRNLQDLSK